MLDGNHSKKHRVRTTPVSLLPGDRKERLCAMAAEAREKLRPWALQPASGVSTFNRLYMALGEQEGVDFRLRHLASGRAERRDVQESSHALLLAQGHVQPVERAHARHWLQRPRF